MSLVGVIGSFATGVYEVTRATEGTYDENGRLVAGVESSFEVEGVLTALSGDDLQVAASAEHADETRVLYTTTELYTRTRTHEPDRVSALGSTWEVFRVERRDAFGDTHYKVYLSRLL